MAVKEANDESGLVESKILTDQKRANLTPQQSPESKKLLEVVMCEGNLVIACQEPGSNPPD